MQALAQTTEDDCYTRAANDDCFYGGPGTRTKFEYDSASRLVSGSSPAYSYSYDAASNLTSIGSSSGRQTFAYTPTNSLAPGTYDANGSLTILSGNSYVWDGANRLVGYSDAKTHVSSSFTYDGLGRLVRVVDSKSGSITADHSYTWCGWSLCLAHNNRVSGSPVSTQYFDQGVITGATSYYYVKDILGSVSQLVTNNGSVAAQYTYDPYGNKTVVSGTAVADVGFAGYFNHAASGLQFALSRAYDPAHGRWLNRDPIGEEGGANLYAYVSDDPVSLTDMLGLCATGSHCFWYAVRKKGASITGDALGAVPLAGNVISLINWGFTAYGTYGAVTGTGMDSIVGGATTSVGTAATIANEAVEGSKVLPGIGIITSILSGAWDIWQAHDLYKECMQGKEIQ